MHPLATVLAAGSTTTTFKITNLGALVYGLAAAARDALVPVESALGRHPTPELTLDFPADHQWVGAGMSHVDLLSRPEVYDRLRGWLDIPHS